ncbi:MAG: peptidoglycan editing factor PgeF [Pseudomonadota bacterium]
MTLQILTSPILGAVRHGFFTRIGGASSGVFAGLNCGTGSSDQAEAVAINRARVAEAMDLDEQDLVTVHQVHSAEVVDAESVAPDNRPQADGLVTTKPGIALAILTADCQPVLFADARAGVIAAAHAGWRGALNGILEATITAMEARGAARSNIVAAIGPAISQRNYEVGPELRQAFTDDDSSADRFFVPGAGDRLRFDLPGYSLARLFAAGVTQAQWVRHCTYADVDRFFSYRRSQHLKEADYGRLISVIRL